MKRRKSGAPEPSPSGGGRGEGELAEITRGIGKEEGREGGWSEATRESQKGRKRGTRGGWESGEKGIRTENSDRQIQLSCERTRGFCAARVGLICLGPWRDAPEGGRGEGAQSLSPGEVWPLAGAPMPGYNAGRGLKIIDHPLYRGRWWNIQFFFFTFFYIYEWIHSFSIYSRISNFYCFWSCILMFIGLQRVQNFLCWSYEYFRFTFS